MKLDDNAAPVEASKHEQCLHALRKAKLQLMLIKNSGFTVSVLLALKLDITNAVKTAAVDGLSVFINPDFFLSKPEPERVGLLAHEAWHLVLDHLSRADEIAEVDLEKYNKAADHVINLMLKSKGYSLPKEGLADPQYSGMTTEQVYALLEDDPSSPNPMQDIIPPSASPATQDSSDSQGNPVPAKTPQQIKDSIDDLLMQSAISNESAGEGFTEDLPSALLKRIHDLAKPNIPWSKLYKKFLLDRKRDDYSFKRRNKRVEDFYMPALYNESCKDFVVATDISYSISADEISAFFKETEYARKQLKPTITRVIQWHTQIASIHEIGLRESLGKIPFEDTGGTNIYPLFEYLIKNPPKSCVIFTDGEFSMWDKPSLIKFPVIWVIYNRHRKGEDWFKPSFGQVVYYEPDIEQ